jgi:DNA-directed RNA polymerase specialized sigma24 family protein
LMDMQVNAVEVALHRALARLRGELERDRGDDPTFEPRAGTTP